MSTSGGLYQAWILNFLGHTEAINKSLLFLDLFLLLVEFQLHCLQLFGQEYILCFELFSGDCQLLILLLHVHKVGPHSAELLLPLIDLIHVVTCFEAGFLDQLALVLRKTIDLGLQILDLVLLFLVDGDLLGKVVLALLLLVVH